MSSAICFNCGHDKAEPLKRCSNCGAKPATEENMTLSVMLTPEMLSAESLANSATLLKAGKRLAVKDELREKMLNKLRSMGVTVPPPSQKPPAQTSPAQPPPPQQTPPQRTQPPVQPPSQPQASTQPKPQPQSQPQPQPQRSNPPPQPQSQPPPQAQAQRTSAPPPSSTGPSFGYRLGATLRRMLPVTIIVGLFVLGFVFLHPWPHFKWASYQDEVSSYESFLKRFPRSTYDHGVKNRVRILNEPKVWAAANGSSNLEELRSYRNTYPDGANLEEAKTQIQTITDAAWAKIAQTRSLKQIEEFLAANPETSKKAEAQARVQALHDDFTWVREQDSLEIYQKFLARFPTHPEKAFIEKRIIDLEVKQIASGKYGDLPPAQPTSLGGERAVVEIANDTGYELTVRYSGPDSQKVVVPVKGRKSLSLAPGSYQVAASVNASHVTNFYGTDNMRGGSYSNSFYIKTTRF